MLKMTLTSAQVAIPNVFSDTSVPWVWKIQYSYFVKLDPRQAYSEFYCLQWSLHPVSVHRVTLSEMYSQVYMLLLELRFVHAFTGGTKCFPADVNEAQFEKNIPSDDSAWQWLEWNSCLAQRFRIYPPATMSKWKEMVFLPCPPPEKT